VGGIIVVNIVHIMKILQCVFYPTVAVSWFSEKTCCLYECKPYKDIFLCEVRHLYRLLSVHWHYSLGIRKGIWHEKIELSDAGMVICLEQGAADLSMVQLILITVPSYHVALKSRMVLSFWCQHIQVVLKKRPLNRCLFCLFGHLRGDSTLS